MNDAFMQASSALQLMRARARERDPDGMEGPAPLPEGEIEAIAEETVEASPSESVYEPGTVDDRALCLLQSDIESSSRVQAELSPMRQKWYRLYRAQLLGNEREGRSQYISTDVLDTIESVIPNIMRVFFSTDQVVSCVPVGDSDERKADLAARLLNSKFRQSGGFLTIQEALKGALLFGSQCCKISWNEEYNHTLFNYDELSEEDYVSLTSDESCELHSASKDKVPYSEEEGGMLSQAISQRMSQRQPQSEQEAIMMQQEIESVIQGALMQGKTVYRNVSGTRNQKVFEGAVMESIPPEDILYDPTCKNFMKAKYIIHRVRRTLDYLYRMQDKGVYHDVDLVAEYGSDSMRYADGGVADQERAIRFSDSGRSDPMSYVSSNDSVNNRGRTEITVYEWWGDFDPDNSGRLVPYVIVMANNVIIRCERNPYNFQRPPFVFFTPVIDMYKSEGIGFGELVGPMQEGKSAIMRQMLDNTSFQNNGMWEVLRSGNVEINSLKAPRPGGIVRTNILNSVRALTPVPLNDIVYRLLEFLQTQIEQRTGVTRYNQGLDAKTLNHTATGITAIMGASQQRMELMARNTAETGLRDYFKFALSMEQQFSSQMYIVRIFDEPLQIAPDDIVGVFDIDVQVGVSAGRTEQAQGQCMQLLNMGPQLMQNGAMTPDNIYEIMLLLFSLWGLKSPAKYITNPKFSIKTQQQMEQMQQQLQQMGQQMQQYSTILNNPQVSQVVSAMLQSGQIKLEQPKEQNMEGQQNAGQPQPV